MEEIDRHVLEKDYRMDARANEGYGTYDFGDHVLGIFCFALSATRAQSNISVYHTLHDTTALSRTYLSRPSVHNPPRNGHCRGFAHHTDFGDQTGKGHWRHGCEARIYAWDGQR